jgi:hypothetical protein
MHATLLREELDRREGESKRERDGRGGCEGREREERRGERREGW